jgi:hypothetical protein
VFGICLLLAAASHHWDRSAVDDVLPPAMSKKGNGGYGFFYRSFDLET